MRKVGRIIQLDRKRYRSRFRVFLYLRVLIKVGWEIQGLSGRTGLYWVRTKGAKEESRPKIKINWKMFKIKMLPNNKMLEIKHVWSITSITLRTRKHVWSITLHWEPENTCGPSHLLHWEPENCRMSSLCFLVFKKCHQELCNFRKKLSFCKKL